MPRPADKQHRPDAGRNQRRTSDRPRCSACGSLGRRGRPATPVLTRTPMHRSSTMAAGGRMTGGPESGRYPAVDIFVAGMCDGGVGPGGWGAVLRYGEHIRELNGIELAPTTSERMTLTAAANALARLSRPVSVRLHADRAAVGRHLDIGAGLASAARSHQVAWVGASDSGTERTRAGDLARNGLLEARKKLAARCVHDLVIRQCWQCRPKAGANPNRVAITHGGAVFHIHEGCAALHRGWQRVEWRGGAPDDLRWVSTVDALAAGRGACRNCCAALPPM